ncbi:MAG: hypothetical protein EPN53_10525 [Acidobacteria bacterium]|nr:MAG: hypothetical protein EPN53_10525 [Acidobacteriota bacterium]
MVSSTTRERPTGGATSSAIAPDPKGATRERARLPRLPCPLDALEPHDDARTPGLHHGKHHLAFVNSLNAALDKLAAEVGSRRLRSSRSKRIGTCCCRGGCRSSCSTSGSTPIISGTRAGGPSGSMP